MLNIVCGVYRFFFSHVFLFKFNRLLYSFGLRGLGVLNFESDAVSGEACFIKSILNVNSKGIIFDVGANIGNYSGRVRGVASGVDIFCFEPHPVNFALLQNKKDDLSLNVFQCGVGSSTGRLSLYDYADDDGSSHASLYKDVIEGIHKGKSISHEVDVICLDDFSDSNGVERVFLLKVDTEGHELEVLKGFQRYIKAGRVDFIHFEFNEMNVASRVFFKDFWDFLPNYDFYRMMPHGLLPITHYTPVSCEIFAYQNIVAKLKVGN